MTRPPFTQSQSAGIWVGLTLFVASSLASMVAAPFLVPYLQGYLLVTAIPGAACGLLAGLIRSRVAALATVTMLGSLYVACNFGGEGGIRAAVEMHLLKRPRPGVMYYDTWAHLFHALVIPMNYGAALIVCELFGRRRCARDLAGPPACAACGYNLTGNASGRCPECGMGCGGATPPSNT